MGSCQAEMGDLVKLVRFSWLELVGRQNQPTNQL